MKKRNLWLVLQLAVLFFPIIAVFGGCFPSEFETSAPKITAAELLGPDSQVKTTERTKPKSQTPQSPITTLSISPTIEPVMPPSGKEWILAFSMSDQGKNGIYDSSGDSEKIRNITEKFDPQVQYSSPSWSPDGQRIAYFWGAAGVNDTYIRIVGVDGKNDQELTNGYDPSWSPDGKKIAFVRKGDIYLINLDTKKIIPLLKTRESVEAFPSWSPDGQRIVYLSFGAEPTKKPALYMVKSDGTLVQRINMEISPGWSRAAWSPDGKRLAFRSYNGCGDIYVIEMDDNEVLPLTQTLGGERDPSWSPDGEWIVFSATNETRLCNQELGEPMMLDWRLFLMNSKGEQIHPLFSSFPSAQMTSPVWSPNFPLELEKKFSVSLFGDQLPLYKSPSLTGNKVQLLTVGEIITPIEGPLTNEGHRWWKVKGGKEEFVGWVVEEPGKFRYY